MQRFVIDRQDSLIFGFFFATSHSYQARVEVDDGFHIVRALPESCKRSAYQKMLRFEGNSVFSLIESTKMNFPGGNEIKKAEKILGITC